MIGNDDWRDERRFEAQREHGLSTLPLHYEVVVCIVVAVAFDGVEVIFGRLEVSKPEVVEPGGDGCHGCARDTK